MSEAAVTFVDRGRFAPVVEFFIISGTGHTLLQHQCREADVVPGIVEMFYRRIVREAMPPVFGLRGVFVAWIKRDALLFMCYTKHNPSPALLTEFLSGAHSLVSTHVGFDDAMAGGPGEGGIKERSIVENQPLLYELMQEVVTDGVVQTTDHQDLGDYMQNCAAWRDIKAWHAVVSDMRWMDRLRTGIGAIDRRAQAIADRADESRPACVGRPLRTAEDAAAGADKRRNEVYLDVTEAVDVHFLPDGFPRGGTIRALGSVTYKAFLDGAPIATLSLGNVHTPADRGGSKPRGATEFRHCSVDSRARQSDFEQCKKLTFPLSPGGHCVLRYEVREGVTLPFMLCSSVAYPSADTMVVTVKIRAVMDVGTRAVHVRCYVPIPRGDFLPSITYGIDRARSKPGHSTKVLESLAHAERSRVHMGDLTHRLVLWQLGPVGAHDPEHVLSIACKRPPGERSAGAFRGSAELRFELLDWLATPLRLGDPNHPGGVAESCEIAHSTHMVTPKRWVRRLCKHGSYTVDVQGLPAAAQGAREGAAQPAPAVSMP
eukprot:TRINITY_DN39166_c0_g1_i1.p1 TRINITY_DN39166_c0_g1~~TRINITY_DN39166_c0_g1_i1.p1  ORF type:complete len:576 (+),score=185.14 TRINITY_DN39166_c0_g1_i1:98-1729(+)